MTTCNPDGNITNPSLTPASLTGLVLCGGQSTRMGTDKGLIAHAQGRTWAETACHKLAALHIPVYISVHPAQLPAYQAVFESDKLLSDTLPLRGPLAGLLTAHLHAPATDWLVLACDLPHMQPAVLRWLRRRHTARLTAGCTVFSTAQGREPLCGLYTAVALRQVFRLYEKGMLPKASMQAVLDVSPVRVTPLPSARHAAFANCNTPASIR